MANYRSDPTANAAIGSVDREIRAKRKEAARLASLYRQNRLSAADLKAARRAFSGIFRPILEEALGEGAHR